MAQSVPSLTPTLVPTGPSLPPTSQPSRPSCEPSSSPTTFTVSQPTEAPTETDTHEPSLQPTSAPSNVSGSPSVQPSTIIPSVKPSESPSHLPTTVAPVRMILRPTYVPTNPPTQYTEGKSSLDNSTVVVISTAENITRIQSQHSITYIINATNAHISITNSGSSATGDTFTLIPTHNITVHISHFNNQNDKIDLRAFTYITGYSNLVITQGSVIVTLSHNHVIRILNLNPSDVTVDNFIFYTPVIAPQKENTQKLTKSSLVTVVCVVVPVFALLLWLVYQYIHKRKPHKTDYLPNSPLVTYTQHVDLTINSRQHVTSRDFSDLQHSVLFNHRLARDWDACSTNSSADSDSDRSSDNSLATRSEDSQQDHETNARSDSVDDLNNHRTISPNYNRSQHNAHHNTQHDLTNNNISHLRHRTYSAESQQSHHSFERTSSDLCLPLQHYSKYHTGDVDCDPHSEQQFTHYQQYIQAQRDNSTESSCSSVNISAFTADSDASEIQRTNSRDHRNNSSNSGGNRQRMSSAEWFFSMLSRPDDAHNMHSVQTDALHLPPHQAENHMQCPTGDNQSLHQKEADSAVADNDSNGWSSDFTPECASNNSEHSQTQ